MGKVLTINKKIQFDSNIDTIEKTKTTITIDNEINEVETIVFPQGEKLLNYSKFNIEFYKKCNIIGKVHNRDFNSFLRKYIIPVYVKDESDYVFSIGNNKGVISKGAFKRLRRTTKIKCEPVEINLEKTVACITQNIPDTKVVSGWFTNLGEQLQNALLQGQDVNENADWKKFLKQVGSKLSNIEFKLMSDEYSRGFIIFSLSSRGFVHIKTTISDEKMLSLALRVVELLDKNDLIKSGNDDDVEEEENIFIDN